MADTKTCATCGETKPLVGGFYRTQRRGERQYWRTDCNLCDNRKRNRTVIAPTPPPPPLPTREEMRTWFETGCRIA